MARSIFQFAVSTFIVVQGVSRRVGTLPCHVAQPQRTLFLNTAKIRSVTCQISVSELYTRTCTDQNPDGPKRDKKTDRLTRIFVGQRRMVILCQPELVLFPACCCVIVSRLVCCFRYSWCVARLMRAGPRRDWPRRKPFRTKHPYHRLIFFKKAYTNGTLNTLPTCQNLNGFPRFQPRSQAYKKKGLAT